jgi:hypothetical protein
LGKTYSDLSVSAGSMLAIRRVGMNAAAKATITLSEGETSMGEITRRLSGSLGAHKNDKPVGSA